MPGGRSFFIKTLTLNFLVINVVVEKFTCHVIPSFQNLIRHFNCSKKTFVIIHYVNHFGLFKASHSD